MRSLTCAALVIGLSSGSCLAADPTLTVVISFEKVYSPVTVNAMKREVERLLRSNIEWKAHSEITLGESFANVALVNMKGACDAHKAPPPGLAPRTALAYTHTSNGSILPFSDVECDRVRAMVRSNNDATLGRALGRVVAHELRHILTQSVAHTRKGYAQPALSTSDLTTESDSIEVTR